MRQNGCTSPITFHPIGIQPLHVQLLLVPGSIGFPYVYPGRTWATNTWSRYPSSDSVDDTLVFLLTSNSMHYWEFNRCQCYAIVRLFDNCNTNIRMLEWNQNLQNVKKITKSIFPHFLSPCLETLMGNPGPWYHGLFSNLSPSWYLVRYRGGSTESSCWSSLPACVEIVTCIQKINWVMMNKNTLL